MTKTTEQMLAAAKAAGITVTLSTKSTGGEVVVLPGIRASKDERPA